MSRALFAEVYRHWRSLPADARPRLFLHGLSLGALNSDLSFDLYDIIDQPFDGALWSGPPFRTETWRQVTAQRDPGSPAWRPSFRGGSVVRFMNQGPHPEPGNRDWGAFRMLFLQYASDPITFFSFESRRASHEFRRTRVPDRPERLDRGRPARAAGDVRELTERLVDRLALRTVATVATFAASSSPGSSAYTHTLHTVAALVT